MAFHLIKSRCYQQLGFERKENKWSLFPQSKKKTPKTKHTNPKQKNKTPKRNTPNKPGKSKFFPKEDSNLWLCQSEPHGLLQQTVPYFPLSLHTKLFHSYLFDGHPTKPVDCLTQVRRGYSFSHEVHGLRNHLQQQQK